MQRQLWIAGIVVVAALAAGAVAAVRGGFTRGAANPQGFPAPRIDRVTVTRVPEATVPGRGSYAFDVTIEGEGFFGTAFGPFVRFGGAEAVAVILDSERRITAYGAPSLAGRVQVEVENPDHQRASASVEFR